MFLHSNIKFLRTYAHLTQAEFGKTFKKTRSNIDSYERGVTPDTTTQLAIANHFNLSLDVLINKDLKSNPGLLLSGNAGNKGSEDLLKAKDDMIKDLRSQVKYLQEQYNQLLKKLKVA